MAFYFYLIYMASLFLHLANRFPVLGAVHIDFLLIVVTGIALMLETREEDDGDEEFDEDRSPWSHSGIVLLFLFTYIVLSLPFVTWPGSVLGFGVRELAKGIIFYYFTVRTVTTERRLKIFLTVFIVLQTIRVFEPTYLHVFHGYWGSKATIGYDESMERLAGAPADWINPNGLAFIIVFVLPFFHFLAIRSAFKYKLIYLCSLPVFVYALLLTGSRSGLLAMFIVVLGIIVASKRKILLTLLAVICVACSLSSLGDVQKERFESIYRKDVRHAATAQGRIEGLKSGIRVVMDAPIIGHGLGTSREATFNVLRQDLKAHNLYLEVAQELGCIKLLIFLAFIVCIIQDFFKCRSAVRISGRPFLINATAATGTCLAMNLFFSLASYGLLTYVWYMLAGLIVVIHNLAGQAQEYVFGQQEEEVF